MSSKASTGSVKQGSESTFQYVVGFGDGTEVATGVIKSEQLCRGSLGGEGCRMLVSELLVLAAWQSKTGVRVDFLAGCRF